MERLRPYLRLRYINAALFALVVLVAALVFGPLALSGPAIVGVTPAEGAAAALGRIRHAERSRDRGHDRAAR